MDGIEMCELCGSYVNEGDLTQCTCCHKDCCDDCLSLETVICFKCDC